MVDHSELAILGARICLGEEPLKVAETIEAIVKSASNFLADSRPSVAKAAKTVLAFQKLPAQDQCDNPCCPNIPRIDERARQIHAAYKHLLDTLRKEDAPQIERRLCYNIT